MRGHGVPVGAGLKLSKTHSKLTALHYLRVNILIDNSLVAILNASAGNLSRLGDIDLNDGIFLVSGAGGHIELCRVLLIKALERGDLEWREMYK